MQRLQEGLVQLLLLDKGTMVFQVGTEEEGEILVEEVKISVIAD